MADRRRASMREGPLADLLRSTTPRSEQAPAESEPPDSEGDEVQEEEETPVETASQPRTARRSSPEPERAPKERVSRIFPDDVVSDPEPAAQMRPASSYEGEPRPYVPVIRVVGVGGAGVNAINRMIEAEVSGVEFIAINTDLQSLQTSAADVTVHLGSGEARGLGTGSDPELGYKSAFEQQEQIKRLVQGSDMVFVTAGVGGGTGTGAAPVIARQARDAGALTVGIVTRPFRFEGARRARQAEQGIETLAGETDTLIVVPNEKLLSVLAYNTTMIEAFRLADDVLRQGVQGISELITLPGLINLDFADVRTIMHNAGRGLLGIGMGTGEDRALTAAQRAVSSPLLETSVEGARSILLSITGGEELSLLEVSEAANVVKQAAHSEANIIFGANVDQALAEQVWVTVIATRFDGRGRGSDGRFGQERRGVGAAATAARRSDDRGPGSGKRSEKRSRDLSIDVPEFIPR